jgi:uncharacterized membrane protein YuzA (DUF378 family)
MLLYILIGLAAVVVVFANCDNMIGKDFEKGLAQMKAVAEGAARK